MLEMAAQGLRWREGWYAPSEKTPVHLNSAARTFKGPGPCRSCKPHIHRKNIGRRSKVESHIPNGGHRGRQWAVRTHRSVPTAGNEAALLADDVDDLELSVDRLGFPDSSTRAVRA